VTLYSSVVVQARFHLATNEIYGRVISTPHIPAAELLRLDDTQIGGWLASLPPWYTEGASVPHKFEFSHSVLMWRCRNFRIIMYRSFVIKRAFQVRGGLSHTPTLSEKTAYDRCLDEARATIASIHTYWTSNVRNRLNAWYAL
jgi:transcriptional regulatory protein GAL4